VPVSAFVLAIAAAAVHALWNLLIARAVDPEAATAVALSVAVVAFAPVAAAVWDVDRHVWPYLVATSLFELAYFALLAAAYRHAHLSVIYPLARGTAPVLVLVAGALVLGAGTSWPQGLGVVLVGAGVLLVRGGSRFRGADLRFALPIAACIASYTLIDKRGIRHATPLVYLELSMIVPALAYSGGVAGAKGIAPLRAAASAATFTAGIATFGAYALVLAALQRASAASVAAVRETSVVIAAALARIVLAEPVGLRRLAGAALVVAGIALLALA
jgi:drug/metabolite transporter (DMT)-like permease